MMDVLVHKFVATPEKTCTVPGCGKPHQARGYCMAHYYQFRRKGEIKPTRRSGLVSLPSPRVEPAVAEVLEREAETRGLTLYALLNEILADYAVDERG